MLSAKPHRGDPIDGWTVRLDRDDAHRFGNALQLETPQQRHEYAAKVESLRQYHNQPMEVTNKLAR